MIWNLDTGKELVGGSKKREYKVDKNLVKFLSYNFRM